jgi:hypothetical protein
MNKILFAIFNIIILVSFSNADCELNIDNKTKAQDLYIEAASLFSDDKYSEAYASLQKSFSLYDGTEDVLKITYTCTHYIPGPYAPVIKRVQKDGTKEFQRLALGKRIKNFLNPNPYALIQYKKNITKVTVLNTPKTGRVKREGQLMLEDFKVSIDGNELSFGSIESGVSKSLSINKTLALNSKIKTNEKFDFKLYK